MARRTAELLCVGMNDALMQTRKLILENAGHNVTQARDLRRVKAACESQSFDVVVLGQSLNASEKKRITDMVLIYCKTPKILELHTSIAPELPQADAHLQITAGDPEALTRAVDGLLKSRKTKAGKAATS